MADPDLAERIGVGEVGDEVHLLRGGVAGNAADRLQRDRRDTVAGDLVGVDVDAGPAREGRVLGLSAPRRRASCADRRERAGDEVALHRLDRFRRQRQSAIADRLELALDLVPDGLEALLVHEDLDARLELVVAPPLEVVHAHDRLGVGEEIRLRQELAHGLADHRRATLAAADEDAEADLAGLVADELVADVMHLDRRAILARRR